MQQRFFDRRPKVVALLAVVALALGWTVVAPGTASASTGGAARGYGISGTIGEVLVDGNVVVEGLTIDHVVTGTPAPDANGNGELSAGVANMSFGGGIVTTGIVTADSLRTTDGIYTEGSVSDISFNLFGIPIVSADLLSGRAVCPITESGDAPTAEVDDVTNLLVNGAPQEVGETSAQIPVDIGVTGATSYITVFVGDRILETSTTAEGVGLVIDVNLHVSFGGDELDFALFDFGLGGSECTSPDGAIPTAAAITPTSGGRGTTASITGSGFIPGATTVDFGGITIPAADVVVDEDLDDYGTQLWFTVPAGAALGVTSVTATTVVGTTSALNFVVLPEPPTASGLSPGDGPRATTLTVSGDHFVPGGTSVTFGSIAIPADAVTVASDGRSLTLVVPLAAGLGVHSVSATTAGGATAPLSFTVTASRPEVTGVSPGEGPAGTTVTITGGNFIPGGTAVALGETVIAPSDVTVTLDGRSLTFVVPEDIAVGAHDLVVVTFGGASAIGTFTVTEAVVPITPSGDLPYTGSGSTGPLVLTGLMLLLVGAALAFAAMVARRRPTAATLAASAARAGRRRGGRL